MAERNEITSKRVATIAGRLARRLKEIKKEWTPSYLEEFDRVLYDLGVKRSELATLAASCLTQTAPKPKKANTATKPFAKSLVRLGKAVKEVYGKGVK